MTKMVTSGDTIIWTGPNNSTVSTGASGVYISGTGGNQFISSTIAPNPTIHLNINLPSDYDNCFYKYQGGQFVDVTNYPTLSKAKEIMKEEVTLKRIKVENSAMFVDFGSGNVKIAMDEVNIRLMTLYYIAAKDEILTTFNMPIKPEGWLTLDAAQMIVLGEAMINYIAACRTRERELHDLIDTKDTAKKVMKINYQGGWP